MQISSHITPFLTYFVVLHPSRALVLSFSHYSAHIPDINTRLLSCLPGPLTDLSARTSYLTNLSVEALVTPWKEFVQFM